MKSAFSLMELMVVVVILGLLAMFTLPNLTGKSDEAKEKLVCIQMKSLESALNLYRLDKGSFPTTAEGLEQLKNGGYLDGNQVPKDSWKNDYIYISKAKSFELISKGADLEEETEDDIVYSKCFQ